MPNGTLGEGPTFLSLKTSNIHLLLWHISVYQTPPTLFLMFISLNKKRHIQRRRCSKLFLKTTPFSPAWIGALNILHLSLSLALSLSKQERSSSSHSMADEPFPPSINVRESVSILCYFPEYMHMWCQYIWGGIYV